MLSRREVEQAIRGLLGKYHADYAILFGSYARESANANSDIDVVLVGGAHFRARDVFAFGEELRQLTHKDVDAFELREINRESDFYRTVMREGVRIARKRRTWSACGKSSRRGIACRRRWRSGTSRATC